MKMLLLGIRETRCLVVGTILDHGVVPRDYHHSIKLHFIVFEPVSPRLCSIGYYFDFSHVESISFAMESDC